MAVEPRCTGEPTHTQIGIKRVMFRVTIEIGEKESFGIGVAESDGALVLYAFKISIWIGPSARPWMNWST